jgi:hypothetical protein
MSDNVDFKLTLVKRDKEGHFILVKGAIHENKMIIINLYSPNVSVPNLIKGLKAHIDTNTVVVGNFNIPLSPIRHPNKKSIKKS